MVEESKMPKIDLNPHEWAEMKRILKTHVPQYEVWAFGSRVEWTAKEYSDLDLVVMTNELMSLSAMADLKEAFDESDMTIKVDVLDWASLSENFRNIIKRKYLVIQKTDEDHVTNK